MRSDARPHQRLLLVPQPRQRLLRVQAAVFLPLLRRLGGLGGGRHRGGAPALRAQAARLATDVGRARGARRDRDGPAHLRRGARRAGRAVHRRRRAAHARRLALVARRSLTGHSQDARALRARIHAGPQGRGVAGPQPQRDLVPAQLLPAAAARRDPQDRLRALVDRALEQGARLRGHADLDRPRLRLLDRRGPSRADRLEDGRRRSRRGRLPARLLRALCEGHARRGPREGGPRGGQPARADGDAAPLGRRQAGRHPRAAAAVHPRDEGLSRRARRERRGDGRLRAYGRAADLPLVQFPGRVPPRALAVPVRRALLPLVLGLCAAGLAPSPAPAAITTIEVRRTEPFADGTSFGATGAYVKVVGVAHGELDPAAAANRAIVNLDRAPKNERGRVEYDVDFYVLRPADPNRGNHKILYEVDQPRPQAALRVASAQEKAMSQSKYPVGWDEERVRRVLEHYETQLDEEAVAEDEAAYEATTHTAMEVPVELVPAVRELIAKRRAG